jgi:hypothetical protein
VEELHELQTHSERCPQVAIVIVTRINDGNLDVLAPLRCHSIVDLERLEDDLPCRVLTIIERTPRQLAAAGLLCRNELSSLTRSIVEEVLLADKAVRDMADLERRLDRPSYQIRRTWKHDLRSLAPVRLSTFLKFGRRLRGMEMLAGGASVQDVAVRLDVDGSTVYRDLRGWSPLCGPVRTDMILEEYLAAFRLIGGPVPSRTTHPPSAGLFRIANALFRFALVGLLYLAQRSKVRHT